MPAHLTATLRARREAIVNAHIEAEAVKHDPAATVATFRRPRYDIPAMGGVIDGAEGVQGLISQFVSAFPDFYIDVLAYHHAEEAVIVEVRFGGTQHNVWAGVPSAGNRMEVQAVLIFVFDDADLICEKVYFDNATVVRQLTAQT